MSVWEYVSVSGLFKATCQAMGWVDRIVFVQPSMEGCLGGFQRLALDYFSFLILFIFLPQKSDIYSKGKK